MKKIKDLYEAYKDMQDCTCTEFINLYDSMLVEFNKLGLDIKELGDMYNHECAVVNKWPTSNGSDEEYNKNRINGFKKMKRILKYAIMDFDESDKENFK